MDGTKKIRYIDNLEEAEGVEAWDEVALVYHPIDNYSIYDWGVEGHSIYGNWISLRYPIRIETFEGQSVAFEDEMPL